jgi:hypothetical protein
MTGSAKLSWELKSIWETSSVQSAGNSLIISLHITGTLYEGSKVVCVCVCVCVFVHRRWWWSRAPL